MRTNYSPPFSVSTPRMNFPVRASAWRSCSGLSTVTTGRSGRKARPTRERHFSLHYLVDRERKFLLNYLPGSASLLSDRAINRLQAQKLRGSLILFQRRDKDEIVQMRQPSKKSLVAAEEILDHVNYGLTRPDIIREWAEVIDENNLPLLEAANDLIDSADTNNGIADARYVQKLRAAL